MPINVKARPEVSEDMRNLGSNDLRREALRWMSLLRIKPDFGLPLGIRAGTGDLSDCRKIYFDEARHRIVYRLVPDETNPKFVDVIVVGARDDLDVYVEAVRRLER